MNDKVLQLMKRLLGLILLLLFGYLTVTYFEWIRFKEIIHTLLISPYWFGIMIGTYIFAFFLKSYGWKLYLSHHTFKEFWVAIHYGLFFNHILPFKAGDLVRTGILHNQLTISWDKSLNSVVVMRILDLISLGFIAGIGIVYYLGNTKLLWLVISSVFILALVLVIFKGKYSANKWVGQLNYISRQLMNGKGLVIFLAIFFSWILEGFVVFSVSEIIKTNISFVESIWVTALAVVSGIFQITPGNISGYESVMSWGLSVTGLDWDTAYYIALTTHLFKFIYAFATGFLSFLLGPVSFKNVLSWLKREE